MSASDTQVERPRRERLGRAALIITLCNLASRITGFVRVLAIASALGIAYLGDAYQRANEVSNVLFELLAGGMLFSVLIPSFVELLDRGDMARARRLGGVLIGRGMVIVGAVALVGMLGSTQIMQALTVGMSGPTRQAQIELGSFLLWFIMPQLVFYLIGSVANAFLQSDHRFVAATLAPVLNNVIVIITMVMFAASHDPASGFALTNYEKLLLGGGTLAGTVAMTALPMVALWRAGMSVRPLWDVRGLNLRPLLQRGMWGAGHVGLNEILIGATIILSGSVDGGVIAYRTAFTFFLLPHALLAHPIFTALFPGLSKKAAAGDLKAFSADLGMGVRTISLLLLVASGLLAVVAKPGLQVVRIGSLDERGIALVASVLAAYLIGLCGYSLYFLLTRASYALEDAKRPTVINAAVTAVSVVGMIVAAVVSDGTAMLVAFGVIQSIAITAGAIVLYLAIHRSVPASDAVAPTVVRGVVAAAVATVCAYGVVHVVGTQSRGAALIALVAASVVCVVVYVGMLAVCKTPELAVARNRLERFISARFGGVS